MGADVAVEPMGLAGDDVGNGASTPVRTVEPQSPVQAVNDDWNVLLPPNDMIDDIFLSRFFDGRGQKISCIWHLNSLFP